MGWPGSRLNALRLRRAGTTTVELALVAPLLIFLLFGIIEFGLIIKDVIGLNQAAREGVRAAAVGAKPLTVTTRVRSAAPTIAGADIDTQYEYRAYNATTGGWSAWTTLGVQGEDNNAGRGDQIRVSLSYPHRLVTGVMFAGLASDAAERTITLRTAIIMQRE